MAATGFLFFASAAFSFASAFPFPFPLAVRPALPATLATSLTSRRPPGDLGNLTATSAPLAISRRPHGAPSTLATSAASRRPRRSHGREKAPKPFDRGISIENLLANLENAQQRPATQRRPATQQRPTPRAVPAALQYAKTPLTEGFLFRHFCFRLKTN